MSRFRSLFSLEALIDFSVLSAIIWFLFSFFDPQVLFTKTITAGGDTASHYYSAVYLKEYILPQGRLIGWIPGNYGGYPLFQFYFPLPFLFMALLSYLIPMQIAFKLITVLGTFLIPPFTYFALKLMRYPFPTPALGALGTLCFLFMEANSMWGANIPSTLAGEFAYSQGMAFLVLFAGTLYHGIQTGRWIILNGIIVALIGFSHGYTILFAGFYSLFFLISTEKFIKNFIYLFKIHSLGFLLMGLWIVPLLMNLSNTTSYSHVWYINSILEVFPYILLPLIALALAGRLTDSAWSLTRLFKNPSKPRILSLENIRYSLEGSDPRTHFLWFAVLLGGVFYFMGNKLHVVDIRFLPFVQLFLMIIGAVELGRVLKSLNGKWLFPIIMAISTFVWVDHNSKSIRHWIDWNYTGFEGKAVWDKFSSINNYLSGTHADPRVVYEHSDTHNEFGTLRAFELLPFFSGRSTLEGLYMQGSLSTPFVFYIQSETSKQISCPLTDYGCSVLNLEAGIKHFKMFNVKDFIVRSKEVKEELKGFPEFRLKETFDNIQVYELSTNENRYVTPLEFEPVIYETGDWKTEFYKWFIKDELSDIHLVRQEGSLNEGHPVKFRVAEGEWDKIPRVPIQGDCRVSENFSEEVIRIKTDCLHRPLLVKVSYHPNWKVEGAKGVFLASPSFMLLYPEKEEVTLRYSKTGVEHTGDLFSAAGFLILASCLPFPPLLRFRRKILGELQVLGKRSIGPVMEAAPVKALVRLIERNRLKILLTVLSGTGLFLLIIILYVQNTDARTLYTVGIRHFNNERFPEARKAFEQILIDFPVTGSAHDAAYYSAATYFREGNFRESLAAFERLIEVYPKSTWVPEATYHIGLSYQNMGEKEKSEEVYLGLIDTHKTSAWSTHAKARLADLEGRVPASHPGANQEGAHAVYAGAMDLFDVGEYGKAGEIFKAVAEDFPESGLADRAWYFYVICYFKESNHKKVVSEFEEFLSRYPESGLVPEAYYHIALSQKELGRLKKSEALFRKIISDFPDSRWAGYSKEKLEEGSGGTPDPGHQGERNK